jgi:hypothetical protein
MGLLLYLGLQSRARWSLDIVRADLVLHLIPHLVHRRACRT